MQEDQKKKNSWKYMTGLNNHGEQFNTNTMLQIQKMQEKIIEEKTDGKNGCPGQNNHRENMNTKKILEI